jgi:large subunit ribosomal protein L24
MADQEAKAKIKMHVKKGDLVHVIGGKEVGALTNPVKRGKVLAVDTHRGRVLVERMNLIKRHTRPNKTNRQGGIVEREGFVHHSNVMLVCPSCNQPTRTGIRKLEDGTRVRFCKKCDAVVDK